MNNEIKAVPVITGNIMSEGGLFYDQKYNKQFCGAALCKIKNRSSHLFVKTSCTATGSYRTNSFIRKIRQYRTHP